MNDIDVSQLLNQLRSTAALARGDTPAANAASEGGFADLLKRSIDGVNEAQQSASKLTQAFESGDKQADLAEVMVALHANCSSTRVSRASLSRSLTPLSLRVAANIWRSSIRALWTIRG